MVTFTPTHLIPLIIMHFNTSIMQHFVLPLMMHFYMNWACMFKLPVIAEDIAHPSPQSACNNVKFCSVIALYLIMTL